MYVVYVCMYVYVYVKVCGVCVCSKASGKPASRQESERFASFETVGILFSGSEMDGFQFM